jgi:fluoroquinolone resistance protein
MRLWRKILWRPLRPLPTPHSPSPLYIPLIIAPAQHPGTRFCVHQCPCAAFVDNVRSFGYIQGLLVQPHAPRPMDKNRFENETFRDIDLSKHAIGPVEYEKCTFLHCDLSAADLSNAKFLECAFMNSDLSNAKTAKTVLRDLEFKECKLLGIHFDQCNTFLLSMNVDQCKADFASFCKLALRKTRFRNSSFQEADFTGADLTGSSFDHCDLTRATFAGSILEKVDFRTAYNFSIDPERNRLRKAKFSIAGLPGLVQKYDIEIE